MSAVEPPWHASHGGTGKGSGIKMIEGAIRRLPVKYEDVSIAVIEIDGIFYLEAQGEKTLIRTSRKKTYTSVQRMGALAKKLPEN